MDQNENSQAYRFAFPRPPLFPLGVVDDDLMHRFCGAHAVFVKEYGCPIHHSHTINCHSLHCNRHRSLNLIDYNCSNHIAHIAQKFFDMQYIPKHLHSNNLKNDEIRDRMMKQESPPPIKILILDIHIPLLLLARGGTLALIEVPMGKLNTHFLYGPDDAPDSSYQF